MDKIVALYEHFINDAQPLLKLDGYTRPTAASITYFIEGIVKENEFKSAEEIAEIILECAKNIRIKGQINAQIWAMTVHKKYDKEAKNVVAKMVEYYLERIKLTSNELEQFRELRQKNINTL